MTDTLTPTEKLRRSMEASTINVKKAFIFSVGWWLRKQHGFKKYPDAYKHAKDNIGMKSLVFGVPRWPKKFERGPLQQQMQMFYKLMEQSLSNDDWQINNLSQQLALHESWYYHKYVSLSVCQELWCMCAVDLSKMTKIPLSADSQHLACQVYDSEDFGTPVMILCDSLNDTGHDWEIEQLMTMKQTPGSPLLRKIGKIGEFAPKKL